MTVIIDNTKKTAAGDGRGPVSAAEKARAKGDAKGGLYKPREPIYPKLVHGQWRRIKWALLILTLAIYYITPWIRWERPGALPDQAVLVDFTGRRFYFFWIQLWPQEVYFITGLLVMAALSLFLVTALFGRLWCGYACPQTVWTDLYIYVERLFEGDRNARMRLAAAPMSFDKFWRKGGKHLVWLGVAFGTGGAWIFYFHDAPTLIRDFWIGRAPMTAYVSCAVLTATTYVFAGHMREQVCTYMCPWPRIQGAMLDDHSLQVTYRADRGEPRGPHKKGQPWEGRGDCIDCNACVVACPMGIDIRNGPQLECINCGLCIDACDEIMVKVGRPKALIAYDTDAAVAARSCGQKPKHEYVRPRTAYYAVALVLVSGIMLWGFLNRSVLDIHALRDRNPTFVRLHDGSIRNAYTLKVANRGFEPVPAEIRFSGVPGAQLRTPGEPPQDIVKVVLPPNEVRAVRVFVTIPADSATDSSLPAAFDVRTPEAGARAKTVFLTGAPKSP
ncbi:cytochrome c oxidase accessory protein CcoG [Phenylobacterium kunshanense]|uniref:Cytochrome c oxidase accessory protein CcoG n=1 Tax=Phenylobacterium kunshanense TaxID=1445034 RepID=A0A328BCL1_9CAUL|nr:cytochrome c oxidase accessory protein CcoG [Phenylobacterium kunshanense]RAK62798.1 cytochrome c oxidase accessory protein CcoG [Phenylobacterium kunshanense]